MKHLIEWFIEKALNFYSNFKFLLLLFTEPNDRMGAQIFCQIEMIDLLTIRKNLLIHYRLVWLVSIICRVNCEASEFSKKLNQTIQIFFYLIFHWSELVDTSMYLFSWIYMDLGGLPWLTLNYRGLTYIFMDFRGL